MWVEKLKIMGFLEDVVELLGMDQYEEIQEITLDFTTLRTKAHDFGKIVCFELLDLGIELVDKNDRPLKCIKNCLFIANTLKISSNNNYYSGEGKLHYLELNI